MDIWQVKYVRIGDLIPNAKNPRKISKEKLERLQDKIQRLGFHNPVKTDENLNVLGGNQRLKALLKIAGKDLEIPVMYPTRPLTQAEKDEIVITDNISDGEWDWEILTADWDKVLTTSWGLDWGEVETAAEEDNQITEDEVPEEIETRCKRGDIWQLGKHRLMCGDSTSIADVEKLMDGAKADMVFTDPPYGMKKEKDGVLNDNLNFDDLLAFNKEWIPLSFSALKENGSWYCWGIDEPLMDIYAEILKPMKRENKISIQNYITWDKGSGFGQLSNLQRSYSIATEKCWFVICGVQGYNNNSDNYYEGFEPIRQYLEEECEKCGGHKIWKQMLGNFMGHHYFTKSQWTFPTAEAYGKMQAFGKEYGAFGKEYEEIKKQYEEIKKQWYETRAYFDNTHDNMNDVWHFNRTSQEERKQTGGHATPKPIALCSRAIKSSSRENETVLDVFGGSGSTLIACEQLNRKCYMMELDEHYCDVIIQRWENLTGEKAVLINN